MRLFRKGRSEPGKELPRARVTISGAECSSIVNSTHEYTILPTMQHMGNTRRYV
jgi:hypothetical protein